MDFIRSNIVRDHTTATEVIKENLPVNPLSHLIISLDGYNATDEATLAEILAFINSVTVSRSGTTIVSLQSEDLYALNCYIFRKRPFLEGKVATDNQRRNIGLIVPFGRQIFNPAECYPKTTSGTLKLQVDTTVPTSSMDNSTINIEAVELPGASPGYYMKSVMHTISAPGATGDNEYDLPIGNKLIAMLIRMTTFSQASSHAYGVDMVHTLVDNKEIGYASARTQCLVADMATRLDGQTGIIAAQGALLPANTVFVDFDPLGDGNFLLDTAGKSRVHTVLEMGVDEATYLTTLEQVAI